MIDEACERVRAAAVQIYLGDFVDQVDARYHRMGDGGAMEVYFAEYKNIKAV